MYRAAILFSLLLSFAAAIPNRNDHIICSPQERPPDPSDCLKAISQIRAERDAQSTKLFSSISNNVAHGDYMYPHRWEHDDCAILVSLRPGYYNAFGSLALIAAVAQGIVAICEAKTDGAAGYMYTGNEGALLVTVMENKHPSLLGSSVMGNSTA